MKGSLLGHGLFEIPSRGPCDSNAIARVTKRDQETAITAGGLSRGPAIMHPTDCAIHVSRFMRMGPDWLSRVN